MDKYRLTSTMPNLSISKSMFVTPANVSLRVRVGNEIIKK